MRKNLLLKLTCIIVLTALFLTGCAFTSLKQNNNSCNTVASFNGVQICACNDKIRQDLMDLIYRYFPFEFQGNEKIQLNIHVSLFCPTDSDLFARIIVPENQIGSFLSPYQNMAEVLQYEDINALYMSRFLPEIDRDMFDYACYGFSAAFIANDTATSRTHEVLVQKPRDGFVIIYIYVDFIAYVVS